MLMLEWNECEKKQNFDEWFRVCYAAAHKKRAPYNNKKGLCHIEDYCKIIGYSF